MLTIVFDLDGTLVDTAPDLIDTLNLVLGKEGLPAVPFESARNMIGGGAKGMIERALRKEGRNGTGVALERMYRAFIAHYAEHIADRSRPFPQLRPAIEELAAAGHPLAVCTNKLEWLSVRLLQSLDLARYFAAICGQDTFGVQKPHPGILKQTISRAGGDPARAVMIGDSKTDVQTARAANVPIIAVDFGYSDVPFASLQPDRIIGSYGELAAAIADVTVRKRLGLSPA